MAIPIAVYQQALKGNVKSLELRLHSYLCHQTDQLVDFGLQLFLCILYRLSCILVEGSNKSIPDIRQICILQDSV